MDTERFTDDTRAVFAGGAELMRDNHHAALDVEHVLLALLRRPVGPAAPMLRRLGVPLDRVIGLVEPDLARLPTLADDSPADDLPPGTARLRRVIARAGEQADQLGDARIGTEHLLLAISGEPASPAARALTLCGITQERVAVELVELRHPLPDLAPAPTQLHSPQTVEQRLSALESAVAELRRAAHPAPERGADTERAARRIAALERQNRYLQELLKITQENLAYTRALLEHEIAGRGQQP